MQIAAMYLKTPTYHHRDVFTRTQNTTQLPKNTQQYLFEGINHFVQYANRPQNSQMPQHVFGGMCFAKLIGGSPLW